MDPDPHVADDLVNSMHFWPLSILGSSAGIGMGKQGGSLSQVALLKRSGLVTTEHLLSFAWLELVKNYLLRIPVSSCQAQMPNERSEKNAKAMQTHKRV